MNHLWCKHGVSPIHVPCRTATDRFNTLVLAVFKNIHTQLNNSVMLYKCSKCDYITKRKDHFSCHLARKNPCNSAKLKIGDLVDERVTKIVHELLKEISKLKVRIHLLENKPKPLSYYVVEQ